MKSFFTFAFLMIVLGVSAQDHIVLVKTFANNSVPQDIVVYNNKLFFSADDGTNGRELWSSDGTEAGTVMVKDILTGGGSAPRYLKVINGKLYFMALETLSPQRLALYVSDGTASGTIKLTTLSTNTSGITSTVYYEGLNGFVYFKNDLNNTGFELWRTDGTVAGTALFKDLYTGTGGSTPDHFYTVGNRMYFNANDGLNGKELWMTDGTIDGTIMLSPGNVESTVNGPRFMTNFNNKVYYEYDGELWATDGTTSGTGLFKQIHPSFKSDPSNFVIYGSRLYFSAKRNGLANELFFTNGTVAGTLPVLANMDGYNCNYIHNVLGMLLYGGKSDVHGNELWSSLGNDGDTRELKNINLGSSGAADGIVGTLEIVEANGLAYFSAVDNGVVNELWRTDGTELGTYKMQYVNAINNDGEPTEITNFSNTVYFAAKYLTTGGLYKIGTGTESLNELNKVQISVFPNPAQREIRFSGLESGQNYTCQIYDLSGMLVHQSELKDGLNSSLMMDLDKGVYFVRLYQNSSDYVATIKFEFVD